MWGRASCFLLQNFLISFVFSHRFPWVKHRGVVSVTITFTPIFIIIIISQSEEICSTQGHKKKKLDYQKFNKWKHQKYFEGLRCLLCNLLFLTGGLIFRWDLPSNKGVYMSKKITIDSLTRICGYEIWCLINMDFNFNP